MLGSLDVAEEVVQNTFLKIWEKREGLEISISLKAYLYRAIHNSCLNQLKHEQVKAQHAKTVLATESEAHDSNPAELGELQLQIHQAIEELPERCREVFELNRFEGLKYKEIADRLGISEKTVENQMGKALKFLRERLAPYISTIVVWMSILLTDIGERLF